MGKVVVNRCYGIFGLSEAAIQWLKEHGNNSGVNSSRHDPILIECVQTLKDKANSRYSNLEVIEFEGNKYRIQNYDGLESVETPNSIKWITI